MAKRVEEATLESAGSVAEVAALIEADREKVRAEMRAEVEELRARIQVAFREGFEKGADVIPGGIASRVAWEKSTARAALSKEPKI